jgi:hypothetical protein
LGRVFPHRMERGWPHSNGTIGQSKSGILRGGFRPQHPIGRVFDETFVPGRSRNTAGASRDAGCDGGTMTFFAPGPMARRHWRFRRVCPRSWSSLETHGNKNALEHACVMSTNEDPQDYVVAPLRTNRVSASPRPGHKSPPRKVNRRRQQFRRPGQPCAWLLQTSGEAHRNCSRERREVMGTEGYCEVFRLAEVRGAIEVLFSRLNKVAAVDPVWSRTSMNAFGRLRKEGQLLSIAHDVEHGLPTRARVSPQPINSKRRMRPLPLVSL